MYERESLFQFEGIVMVAASLLPETTVLPESEYPDAGIEKTVVEVPDPVTVKPVTELDSPVKRISTSEY